ncbi:STAS domain-containing protein [Streptomyces sp. NPDC021224]|uniref:STAS domain-containing protein n=1 Tax=unclassified Streptomyces TaxID=2593676 RepID=UPI003788DD8E
MIRHLRSGLTIRMTELHGRTLLTVRGEIDLDSADILHQAAVDCLAVTPKGIDIDLAGVGFFDCAGLNALLRARALARATGAELTLTALSTAVARVLDLTHCTEVFSLPARPVPPAATLPWSAARPA